MSVVLNTFLAYSELFIFALFTAGALYDSKNMIDCVIFAYIAQILNYKLVGGIPWFAVGGIALYPQDFLIVLMVVVLLVRGMPLQQKVFSFYITVLLLMALQGALRGFVIFGPSSEWFADMRRFFTFGIAILYFWSMPIRDFDRAFWHKLEYVFWGVTVYMWIVMFFYFIGHPIGETANTRPLLADYAIVYTLYLSIRWYRELILAEIPKLSLTTLLFTATLILNRFNTTWVALAAAVILMLLVRPRDRRHRPLPAKFYFQVLAFGVIAYLVLRYGGNVSKELIESSEKFDISKKNTFSSRIELWQGMLGLIHGLPAGIGYPFGSGFHVPFHNVIWVATPHNGYLEMALRIGCIGLFAVVAGMFSVIVRALRHRIILPAVLCAVCMVYWIGYSITLEQGVIIGICARIVFRRVQNEELVFLR